MPVSASVESIPLTLINGENAGASNLPGSDFGVYSGGSSLASLLRAGERSRGLGGDNGVYLDDIVIGLAERGESFTGSSEGTTLVDNPYFEANFYDAISDTVRPVQEETTVGRYQLEVRLGQEYLGDDNAGKDLRFDFNQRLADGFNIQVASGGSELIDGDTFEISNGFEIVRFEFNNVTLDSLITPTKVGNVPIEYRITDTPAQVAQTIRDSINSGSVRSVLGVQATSSSGRLSDLTDPTIVMHGYAAADRLGGTDFTSPESGQEHLSGIATGQNVVLGEDTGDQNRHRDQGQFIVDSNLISFSSGTAIEISAGDTAPGNKVPMEGARPKPGAVQSFPILSSEQLVAGAVVQNNLLISNSEGILLSGNAALGGPREFSRVVNNTIFDSGTGIRIEDRAAPTLLNNVLIDNSTGIAAQNAGPTVIRATAYSGNGTNTTNIGVGTEAIVDPAGPLFVNPDSTDFDLARDDQISIRLSAAP